MEDLFTDDGDGRRVKSALTTDLGTTTAYFSGNYYEVVSSTRVNKYYYAGTQRIAIRSNRLYYMFTDHLGLTSLVAFENGNPLSEMRYSAWGEVRFSWIAGQSTTPAYLLLNYTFTGQYSERVSENFWKRP